MLAAHPARHHAVELAGHGLVDFVAGQGETAHGGKNGAIDGKRTVKEPCTLLWRYCDQETIDIYHLVAQ
jgi:hypothetical protein